MEVERGSNRWHSLGNSLQKRLWICRKTGHGMNELKLRQKIFVPLPSHLLMFTHFIIRRVLSHLLRRNIIDKQQKIYINGHATLDVCPVPDICKVYLHRIRSNVKSKFPIIHVHTHPASLQAYKGPMKEHIQRKVLGSMLLSLQCGQV